MPDHDPDPAATHQAWMNQVMHAPTPVCPEHPDCDVIDEAFSFWCPAGEHAVSYAQVVTRDHFWCPDASHAQARNGDE